MNSAYQIPFRSIGKDVVIWDRAKISAPENISIGDCCIMDDFVLLMGGERTSIGSFVHIAAFASLVGGGRLVVADFVGISGGSRVYTGNDDYSGGSLVGPTVPSRYRKKIQSFVIVEKHVIISANSVVLPNVTIGEGAAIGANSLVKSDCAPWTIYAGTPARPIRERPRETILDFERRLRKEAYDTHGQYIPKHERP
jgi:acetyltransferase-like isoleucine patch superfamily enzyme